MGYHLPLTILLPPTACYYGTSKGHRHGLLGQIDKRSTMGDSNRSHVFPLTSFLVTSDGHATQGCRVFNTETTSTNNAISVPLTSSQAASDGHVRHGRRGSVRTVVSVRSAGNVMSAKRRKKGSCIMIRIKVGGV